jgi:hypothetical protein
LSHVAQVKLGLVELTEDPNFANLATESGCSRDCVKSLG